MSIKEIYGKKKDEGFTIIEVLIVLAIAGVILLIVFLAVPALQRNNRNTQRKNDVSKLVGLVNDFVANNQGTLPTNYGSGAGSATNLSLTTEKFSIMTAIPTTAGTFSACAVGSTNCVATTPALDTVTLVKNATCNGNTSVYSTSARSFVAVFAIEGSTGVQCLQS